MARSSSSSSSSSSVSKKDKKRKNVSSSSSGRKRKDNNSQHSSQSSDTRMRKKARLEDEEMTESEAEDTNSAAAAGDDVDNSESGESGSESSGEECDSDGLSHLAALLATAKKVDKYERVMNGAPHLLCVAALDLNLPVILTNGLLHDAALEAGSTSTMSERDYKTYRIVSQLLPDIGDIFKQLVKNGDKKLKDCFFSTINKKAHGARSTDGHKCKINLAKILSDIGMPTTDAPLPANTGSKLEYGFRNDTTGRLLCPYKLNWDDPAVRQGLLDTSIKVTSADHPLLAYENCKHDPKDDEAGLYRNLAAIKLAKCIFTGPTSIDETPSKFATKAGNAKLAGLTSMTPRTIAYVHCLLRHLLTPRGTIKPTDGMFNYHEYYWMVVRTIEMGEDEFKRSLFSYWNSMIFGTDGDAVTAGEENVNQAPKDDALARLQAQRAAKKEARLAAEAAAATVVNGGALHDVTNAA